MPEPWTSPQRGVLIVLLSALLVYLIVRAITNPSYVSDPQPLLPARALELEDRIDPNTANWNTLAAMPNIGEKRAKDIIAYRERFVVEHPGQVAFTKATDLLRIRGIGSAMLSQIEPYLIFPAEKRSTSTQPR